MDENRKIDYVSGGEQIIFRPANRWGQTIIQSVWVIGVACLLYWSGPALLAFFKRGEITGAARLLDRFHLSQRGTLAAMLAWSAFLAWWGLGGLYEIVKVQLRQDRFLLRSDSLVVKRRKILTHEIALKSYEPMALRLRPLDGALEAKLQNGSRVLTDGGTDKDRQWLLELLQKRYKAPFDLPAVAAATQEQIATYVVEKRPDGVTRITSSGLSTFGCAGIAAVITTGLIALSVWLFFHGSGGGIMTMILAFGIGFGGVAALNKRSVEASRGHLRVQWSTPVAPLLRRVLSENSMILKVQFGEGSYEADSGTLKLEVSSGGKDSSPTYTIVLLREFAENEAAEEESEDAEDEDLNESEIDAEAEADPDPLREDTVLKVFGQGSEYAADHLLQVLAEATGFPIDKRQQ